MKSTQIVKCFARPQNANTYCTVGLILFAFALIVVIFLISLKHYSLDLFVGNLFLEDKQQYLVIGAGTSEEIFAVGYCY